MHLVEFLSFALLPFIPHREFLQIYSSEITESLLLCSSCLRLNIIDGKMNQSSRTIFRGEGEIQVGKVTLFLDEIYGS